MKKVKTIGNYVFPQATLILVAGHMVDNLYRDELEFSKIGIKAEKFEEIKQLAAEFGAIPADFRLKAATIASVAEIRSLKTELVQLIDEVLLPIEFAYGKNSQTFTELGFKSSDFKGKNANILETANDFYLRLTSTGDYSEAALPEGAVENMKVLIDKLNSEISKYKTIKTQKMGTAEYRISVANKLYEKITLMAYFGKRIWMSKNHSLYNSYVLLRYAKQTISPIPEQIETAA